MSTEMTCLAWTLVLAIVQIFAASGARTAQTGVGWNMGARDAPPPAPSLVGGRLSRAQANLFETLPLFAAAVLAVTVTQKSGTLSALGAVAYLAARIVYVPLSAFGVPLLRSLVWIVSLVGLLMVVAALLLH